MPKHLIVLSHGLGGSPSELHYMQKALSKHYEHDVDLAFKITNCNYKKTSDGILNGAQRIFQWLLVEMSKSAYDRISFISHSLGGIYTRCVVGLFHEHGLFQYLKPVNFITLATPHLGSKQHVYLFHNMHAFIVSKFIGQTVLELTMTDSTDPKTTFMYSLCSEKYLGPLKMFPNLVAYSNVDQDYTVNYKTGGIQRSKYHHAEQSIITKDLPLIIKDERTGESFECNCIEDDMFHALDKLHWKRYAVFPIRPMKAHTDIIVKNEYYDVAYGYRVIEHLCNELVLEKSINNQDIIVFEKNHLVILIPDGKDATSLNTILSRLNKIDKVKAFLVNPCVENSNIIERGIKALNWMQNQISKENYDRMSFLSYGDGGLVARYVVGKLLSCKSIPKHYYPFSFICINSPITELKSFAIDEKIIHEISCYYSTVGISLFQYKSLYAYLTNDDHNFCNLLAIGKTNLMQDLDKLTEIHPQKNEFKNVDHNIAELNWNRFLISTADDDEPIPKEIQAHLHALYDK